MALATSVTGTGKLIESRIEGAGAFSYLRVHVSGVPGAETETTKRHTVNYLETRKTHKWYALTQGAVEAYQAANPEKNAHGVCVNEILNAWELTSETVTREIISIEENEIPEAVVH